VSNLLAGLPDVFIGAFGQAVTIQDPLGNGLVATTGIFQARSVNDLGIVVPGAVLHLRDADAATLLSHPTCRVTVGGQTYIPRVGEPDGKGMTPVRLERDSQA
jgi:hypothetical protein